MKEQQSTIDGNPAPDTILLRGGSCIVGPPGQILAAPLCAEEAMLTARIDPGEVTRGKYDSA
jgi:nitrilase